jgi:hypothetical protein
MTEEKQPETGDRKPETGDRGSSGSARSGRSPVSGLRFPVSGLRLLFLLSACTQDFDPYYLLNSPRVLALRSDPVAPYTHETTTLSAYVYTPPGTHIDDRAWSWCPAPGSASDGYPCLVTEDQLGGAVPPFDLGHGETATFENSIAPAALQQICSQNVVDCSEGFPVQIKLVLHAGGAEIVTVRALRLRFSSEQQANANPTIDGLSASVDGADVPIDGATLARRQKTTIRAAVPESAAESYTGRDADGNATTVRERVTLSWFVETGDLHAQRTAFIDGVVPFADAEANTWRPDATKDYAPATARLVVIVRDSRDGVAWAEGTAALGSSP